MFNSPLNRRGTPNRSSRHGTPQGRISSPAPARGATPQRRNQARQSTKDLNSSSPGPSFQQHRRQHSSLNINAALHRGAADDVETEDEASMDQGRPAEAATSVAAIQAGFTLSRDDFSAVMVFSTLPREVAEALKRAGESRSDRRVVCRRTTDLANMIDRPFYRSIRRRCFWIPRCRHWLWTSSYQSYLLRLELRSSK